MYEVPYRRNQEGPLGRVLGGWHTNFIFTAQTGNATQVRDGTGLADAWSRFDRPDLVARPDLARGERTEARYFNVDAFRIVREPRYGTAPPMMVRQPGLWNVDFTLMKSIRTTEAMRCILRADFYNFFNHANGRSIDPPIRDATNPNSGPPGTLANPYGRINGFGDPREIQVGLKLEF